MAEAVHECLQQADSLIVEAGTGVGKTFAYLVPALLSGLRVIISTGTRHLQDQLFHRDLPRVQKALGAGLKTALLKGRANYLCLHRLQQARHSAFEAELTAKIQAISTWSQLTKSGDIAEMAEIAEDDPVWVQATSTLDNCLGAECPEFNQCHLVKARRQAQEADLVVVNHHLFFADMALKDEGFGEVLPSADAFILDEAHQLPETASRFFGQSLSGRQIENLIQDCIAAQVNEAPDAVALRQQAEELSRTLQEFRLALGASGQRNHWQVVVQQSQSALVDLQNALQELQEALSILTERGPDLANCSHRVAVISNGLEMFNEQAEDKILWFETTRRGFALHATPTEIAGLFAQAMQSYQAAWVFTSATLSVAGRFDHFQSRMGISDAVTALFDSPFDFKKQALLFLPPNMPDPADDRFITRLLEEALPVLQASEGRAFLLFTSHRALKLAAEALHDQIDYPLFVQGDAPRSQLLDEFRRSGNGVLLGTSSFWEGVDIRGEALSAVIIDKLPFAAPNDPVLQARLELIRKRGGNPFGEYQLPQAVITLKQGIGRLVRDVQDRGVLMIADPRLRSRGYGKVFINSLPEMPITDDIEDVVSFFRR
ncbi:MAG: ATP-dependent DNA helicase [Gammaproteobacteria bacterium]|nr:ATP-dependent DNA helicase [Gammaproteobacteria bacterium]